MRIHTVRIVLVLFVSFSFFFQLTNAQTNTAGSGDFNAGSTWVTPTQVANGITIQNGHTVNVPTGRIFYSGKINFVGTGKLQLTGTGRWQPGPLLNSFRNCNEILTHYPMSPSGQYTIDPDGSGPLGSVTCQCDMTTDGGGWTLVLNYLHRSGTNPSLNVRTSSLPLLGSTALGTDESASSTTWGHTAPSYLNAFTFTEVRFYGVTSAHSRVIHFKTSHANTINYFKTGSGSMTGINNSFTALTGHTAFLPNSARDYFTDQGNLAMTEFPFWLGGTYHWGIKGLNERWEVDDFPRNTGTGFQFNTHHQIWIR